MKQLETPNEILAQRDQWEEIIRSPSWIIFRKWVEEHIQYLEKQSKDALRKHEDRKAGECLYAADDFKKMLESVRIRLAALNEQIGQK